MTPTLSVILPVYNEKEYIAQAVEGLHKSLKVPFELLVIYDFQEDNTLPAALALQKKYNFLKLIHNKRKGLLRAVLLGFKEAKGSYIVVMSPDADDPKTVQKMYSKIIQGFDVICASRYSHGGKRINQTSFKMFLSQAAGFLSPFILNVPTHDITNGFKMYSRNVIKKIPIKSDGGWEFSMELAIKASYMGYKIGEVGTISKSRKYGVSKFKLIKWLPKYLRWYFYGISRRLS